MNGLSRRSKGELTPVYVGTYTTGGSDGIYVCHLDLSTGELSGMRLAGKADNPSFLAVDAKRLRLFAVNEYLNSGEQAGGHVSAFAIAPSSGQLTLINQQSSGGGAPCHLALDHTCRFLFVANYMGGNVAVFPVGEDGGLGKPTSISGHLGRGPHPQRQEGPHPHSVVPDSVNDYVFVPDLGLDKVMQYQLDQATGQLQANRPRWIEAEPGSGPRHMVFRREMKRAYVINELNSTVTVYVYDSSKGTLSPLQTSSTLPAEYSGVNLAADLHLTPDGRFLYGSNRGHDSLVVYSVDQDTGQLTQVGWTPTRGQRPRAFAVDPGGTFILVANQDSDNIVTLHIDTEKGTLSPTGHQVTVPSPVCLKFLSRNVSELLSEE